MPQLIVPSLPTIVPEILSLLKENFESAECQLESCPNVSLPPFNLSVTQLGNVIYIVPETVPAQEAARMLISGKIISSLNHFHIVSDEKASQVIRISIELSTSTSELSIDIRKILRDYFETKLGTNWEMLCLETSTSSPPKSTMHLLRTCKSEDFKTVANGGDSNGKRPAHKISILLAPIGRRILSGTTKSSNNLNSTSSVVNGTDEKLKKKKIIKKTIKQPPSSPSASSCLAVPDALSNSSLETITNGSTAYLNENNTNQVGLNETLENSSTSKMNGVDAKQQQKPKTSAGAGLVGKMTAMFGTQSRKNSRDEGSLPSKSGSSANEKAVNGIKSLQNGECTPIVPYDRPTSVSEFLARHSSMSMSVTLPLPDSKMKNGFSDEEASYCSVDSTSALNLLCATNYDTSTGSKSISTLPNGSETQKSVTLTTLTNGYNNNVKDKNSSVENSDAYNNNLSDSGLSSSITTNSEEKYYSCSERRNEAESKTDFFKSNKSPQLEKENNLVDKTSKPASESQITITIPTKTIANNGKSVTKDLPTTVLISNGTTKAGMVNKKLIENDINKLSENLSNGSIKSNSSVISSASSSSNKLLPPISTSSKTITPELNFSTTQIIPETTSAFSTNRTSTNVSSALSSALRQNHTAQRLPPISATSLPSRMINSLSNGRKHSPISSNENGSSLNGTYENAKKSLDDDEEDTLLLSNKSSATINDINSWSARRPSNEEDDSEALCDFSFREDFSCSSTTSEIFAKKFNSATLSNAKKELTNCKTLTPSTNTLKLDTKSTTKKQIEKIKTSQKTSNISKSASTKEMVRGMNQIPVVALQQVLGYFTYNELCEFRRVHPHWDELCGQLLNTGYYQLIHAADQLLTDCQRRVKNENYLAKPIQVLTNLQVHVLNSVDMLRAAIDEGVICFPYGLLLDKAFELLGRIDFVIQQNEEVSDALLNWERLADFARRAQIHYRQYVEPEAERRMADVYKFSAAQRLQRIDSFFVEASVNKLEKETEKTKDDMRWEIEQLKTQNQQLKKDNREFKQTCLKLDSRIETLERKFKTMARLLQ